MVRKDVPCRGLAFFLVAIVEHAVNVHAAQLES